MTKYEIYTDMFEFLFGKYKDSIPEMSADEVLQMYFEENANYPSLVKSFDNADEAIEHFRKNFSNWGDTWAQKGNVFWLLRGHVAYIEENQYDEDGEFDCGGSVWLASVAGYEKEE